MTGQGRRWVSRRQGCVGGWAPQAAGGEGWVVHE